MTGTKGMVVSEDMRTIALSRVEGMKKSKVEIWNAEVLSKLFRKFVDEESELEEQASKNLKLALITLASAKREKEILVDHFV